VPVVLKSEPLANRFIWQRPYQYKPFDQTNKQSTNYHLQLEMAALEFGRASNTLHQSTDENQPLVGHPSHPYRHLPSTFSALARDRATHVDQGHELY
jgi:hypothetical protein